MSFIYLTLHPWGSRRDQWFSPDSSTNKTDRHDIAEILLKAMLNTLTPNSACFTKFFLIVSVLMNLTRWSIVESEQREATYF